MSSSLMPFSQLRAHFQGRKVFLTGHTGFKGSWLALWLIKLGAHVSGYALAPHSPHSSHAFPHAPHAKQPLFVQLGLENLLHQHHHIGDICDRTHLQKVLMQEQPDMVIHLAAQALVREGYRDPVGTFNTNAMGTLYVLEALRQVPSCRAALFVTTDKVYDPAYGKHAHVEESALKGEDPYSSSKVCAEQMVHAYARSNLLPSCICATVRAGNVMGGGDRADHRLIPDLIRALEYRQPLHVRYPAAVRPWQHVLEPLMGYLQLLIRLGGTWEGTWGGAWNFGPSEKERVTVEELLQKASQLTQKPFEIVWETPNLAEVPELRLNSRKAEQHLGWKSYLSVDEALEWTLRWYQAEGEGNMRLYTEQQIERYMIQ